MATINDRVQRVSMKLGNRKDLLAEPQIGTDPPVPYSRIKGWLGDAYISTGMSQTFEETELTVPFQTTPYQGEYPLQTDVRAIKAFTGYRPDGTPLIMQQKNMAYIRRYNIGGIPPTATSNVGPPTIWCLWNKTIHIRPFPDTSGPYTFILDYWQKPQVMWDENVGDTELLVPDDWLEFIDYEAAARGHSELLERDKAREIQSLLYGFSDPTTGKNTPGLLQKLMNRDQANAPWRDYGMQPQNTGTRGYTR